MNHTDNLVLRQIYMMCPNDDKPGGNLPVGGPNASGNGSGTAMSGAGGCGTIENPVELPGAEVEGSGTKTDPPQVPTNPPTYPTPYPTMCPVCRAKLDWGVCSMCGYGASGTTPGWSWGSGNNSGSGSGSGSGYGSGNNNLGGGGTVGGGTSPGTPNNNDKKPEFRNDCPPSAAENSTDVRSVIDNKKLPSLNDVPGKFADLRRLASSNKDEHSVVVNYDEDTARYYPFEFATGYINSGTATNVGVGAGTNTILYGHTHGQGQVAAPSPRDVIAVFEAIQTQWEWNKDAANSYDSKFKASIVFAHGGSEYMIYVNDRKQASDFLKNLNNPEFPYADFFIPAGNNTSGFLPGSRWETDYKVAYNNLKDKGKYSQEDAQAHALTYLLDSYNMGLKIYKRNNSNSDFKELKTEIDNKGKYIPKICW